MSESTSTIIDIEALLKDAGFTFTVVDRCPHPECLLCEPHSILPRAAGL